MLPFENILPLPLPKLLLGKIYSYDSTHREDYDKVVAEMRNRENYHNVMNEINLYYNAALGAGVPYYYSSMLSGESVWFWWFYYRIYESEIVMGDPDWP